MITFRPIEKATDEELLQIAIWRNETLASLRTCWPTKENPETQREWVLSMTHGVDAYFLLYSGKDLVGYCGLDKINMNRTAEISCLIGQEWQGNNYATEAVEFLLDYGFNKLGLNHIFGEVYQTTSTLEFWKKCGFEIEGTLPDRKLWQGKFYASDVIGMGVDAYKAKKGV